MGVNNMFCVTALIFRDHRDIGCSRSSFLQMAGFQVVKLKVSNFQHCVVAGAANLAF